MSTTKQQPSGGATLAPVQQCMDHGECFGGKCIYPAPQPAQQEPVVRWDSDGWGDLLVDGLPDGTLLYTSPPAQRTWVGLTDGDLAGCDEFEYKSACFWEAKLKAKNSP